MAEISKISLGGVEYDIRDQKLKEEVEKKVDKTYVDDEAERVVSYAEEVADNAEKAAKKYADDNKVAKVDGKQLSTEDFTTLLKQKLDGLTNYNDAEVRAAITKLQNDLDAIVNGDATSAIDSIQEILAFLSTITDTQTLAGIVADLKQYVDDKVAAGGGGISEETEVYIGEEEPTDDGVKLWIDPTGTPSSPSQPSAGVEVIDSLESESTTAALSANQGRVLKEMIGQGGASGGGSNVFVFPEEVMSDDYTEESPYFFTPEKTAEFLAALENPSSVYVAYQNAGGYIASLHFNIHTVYGFDAVCVSYAMGYLSVMIIHMMMEDDIAKAYKETQIKEF